MEKIVFRLEGVSIKNSTRANKNIESKIGQLFEMNVMTSYETKQEWKFQDGEEYKTSELVIEGITRGKVLKEGIKVTLITKDEVYDLLYLKNKKLKIKVDKQMEFKVV